MVIVGDKCISLWLYYQIHLILFSNFPKKTFPKANDKNSYQNRISKFEIWRIVILTSGVGLTGLFGWGLSKLI